MAKKPHYIGTSVEAYPKADLSKVRDTSHPGYHKVKVGYNDEKDKKDFLDYVDYNNQKTKNEYEIERLQGENERLKDEEKKQPKTVSGAHSADNPDTGIGATDREWKDHKWIARKRGPNGKWIYDYGYGYGVKDPSLSKQQKDNDSKIEALKSDNKRLKRKMDYASGKTASKSPVEKAVNDAKKAVGETAENARKAAENTVSNAKKAVDELLKRLRHTAIIGEDYLEHSDLMDIPVAVTNSIDDYIED